MSEMTTLAEYDYKEEPLIALSCKHLFTISTLDGHVEIAKVYSKDKKGEWSGVLELPAKCGAIPQCPHCREPITNVRSYPQMFNDRELGKLCVKTRKHVHGFLMRIYA